MMQASDHLVISKLTDNPLNQRSRSLKLDIDETVHLNSTRWRGFKSIKVDNDDVHSERYLTRVCDYLKLIKNESKPFNPSYIYEMVKDFFIAVDELSASEKKSRFVFTPEYKVDLALVACSCACDVFKQTTKKVKNDNDPITRLNGLKSTFLKNFKDLYNKVSAEKAAANTLCDLLRSSVEEAVKCHLESKIVDDTRNCYSCLESKRKFKIAILEKLMETSFSMYKTYLIDMRGSFHYWIRYYLDQHKYRIQALTEETLSAIIQEINESIECLQDDKDIQHIKTWLDEFNKHVRSRVQLDQSRLNVMVNECNVLEFTDDVISGCKKIEKELRHTFSNASRILSIVSSRGDSPEDILCNHLIAWLY